MLTFAILIAITIGLVQVIKKSRMISTDRIPLTAVIVGIVLNCLANVSTIFASWTGLGEMIVIGVVIGLSSVGLFSQKSILKNNRPQYKDSPKMSDRTS